ncbi:MAG TPA: hypothetical protein VMI31_02105 [Fimbriimonadaceae bacterium]|nr:hypothetical protein [Fimbriimonadaceae bacterium]
MIYCSSCGKPIDKVPDWLRTAKVEFVCNNCPNRQTKNIAFVSLEVESPPIAKMADDEIDVEDLADEDVEPQV